jgi:ribosome-associated protein
MKSIDVRAQVAMAVQACVEKKAEDINILRLDAASGLTDYFVICSGANPRQVEAIGEAVDEKLSRAGFEPLNIDGRRSADWMVLDYSDFMVHVFSESARKFYDLERLWKTASKVELADLEKPEPKKAAVKKAVGKKTLPKPAAKKTGRKSAGKRTRKGK